MEDEEEEGDDGAGLQTEEEKVQIRRVKELRQQRRVETKEFIPLDDRQQASDQSNANMSSIEGHWLQSQIIKDRYAITISKSAMGGQAASSIVDVDQIYSDQEDQEEVEAFIKKRVKEGSGKDYEEIVRRDMVAYQKSNTNKGSTDFNEINKYEGAKAYKALQSFMDCDEDDTLVQLNKEIESHEKQIISNEQKVSTMLQQEQAS